MLADNHTASDEFVNGAITLEVHALFDLLQHVIQELAQSSAPKRVIGRWKLSGIRRQLAAQIAIFDIVFG